MTTDTTSPAAEAAETALFLDADWFDPLEAGVRTRIRAFIEELLEAELEAALGRKRYARGGTPEKRPSAEAARPPVPGHRHGHRERTLMGTFGAVTVLLPAAGGCYTLLPVATTRRRHGAGPSRATTEPPAACADSPAAV